MVSDDTSAGASPDWARIALIGCCVFATVVAAMLVPALGSDNLAGTPIDSILPGDRFEDANAGPAGGEAPGTGFGALNPGDTTGVGGDTGLDNETFGSNDTEIHFTVESSQPAYWRTGAYDLYTGSNWERTGTTSEYRSPISHDGISAERVDFEITLERPASALPVVWRPRAVTGVDGISVTEARGLRLDEYVEAGTTISGVSRLPEDSVDVLRAAGSDYPDGIENRYTQLSENTPERVEEFTANLTADDETAYDAAMTIQNWLRTQKDYSLKASEQSDSIADTFIFEMDAGYCEYFATAMTVMLRSQDIPARYTVGYSTGQPVGNNTYEVRGMNAHAWVEVYFPEVGWVKFDPTPGGSRLQTQSDVLEEELGEEFDLQEQGSPGEVFEPGEVRQARNETDTDEDESEDGYDISLNRTAVPGLPVEVTITYDGEPVAGTMVSFNGEIIGATDDSGTIVGTVPEDEELHITVTNSTVEPDERKRLAERQQQASDQDGTNTQGSVGHSTSRKRVFAQGETVPPPDSTEMEEQSRPDGANETYPIETGATVTVSGDVFPESTVTVTATVDGVAIPQAAVFVDGEQVTTTDDAGRAQITLPAEPGNVSIAVERGSISGSTALTIPELELTVDTGSVPLPLGTVSVEVTAGDSAVAGAPVLVDGEKVGVTGPDGTATVDLPLARSATIETSKYGMSDTVTVSGLLVNLAGLLVGVAVLVGVPLYLVSRRGYRPQDLLAYVGAVPNLLGYAQLALVRLAKDGDEWLVRGLGKLRHLVGSVVDVLRGRISLRKLAAGVRARLRDGSKTFRDRFGGGPSESSDGDGLGEVNAHGVRQAWEWLLTQVSVGDPETRTPGELATHAIEHDGLPAKPVRVIRDAFRAVEYGSRPATDQLQRVQAAVETIERTREAESKTPADRATTDGGQTDAGRATPDCETDSTSATARDETGEGDE